VLEERAGVPGQQLSDLMNEVEEMEAKLCHCVDEKNEAPGTTSPILGSPLVLHHDSSNNSSNKSYQSLSHVAKSNTSVPSSSLSEPLDVTMAPEENDKPIPVLDTTTIQNLLAVHGQRARGGWRAYHPYSHSSGSGPILGQSDCGDCYLGQGEG
jgi:hypothetical protein